MTDLVARRRSVPFEELNDAHNHARRAEAALEPVAFPETLLDGMQLPVARESFQGRDLRAIGLDGEHRAGLYRLSIDEDGAGAADAGLTSHVRSGQPTHLAQKLNKQHARLDLAFS